MIDDMGEIWRISHVSIAVLGEKQKMHPKSLPVVGVSVAAGVSEMCENLYSCAHADAHNTNMMTMQPQSPN